jgi:uncharacterized protein YfbU (UPF0304 family)
MNSHFPYLGVYRQMLAEWNKSANKMHLSIEDVARIIAIRRLAAVGQQ